MVASPSASPVRWAGCRLARFRIPTAGCLGADLVCEAPFRRDPRGGAFFILGRSGRREGMRRIPSWDFSPQELSWEPRNITGLAARTNQLA